MLKSGSNLLVFNFLIDQEVPVVMCPDDVSDITIGDSKAVQWLPATATDNLALKSENAIKYAPQNGSNFQASADGFPSTVLVEAHDTFGNIGECQFTVTVYKKGRHDTKMSSFTYTIQVLQTLFILLLPGFSIDDLYYRY